MRFRPGAELELHVAVPVLPDLEAELERESDGCSDHAPYVLRRELMTDGSLTKVALIKEGAAVAGFTKGCAEIVVDTVFGASWKRCAVARRSNCAASAASVSGAANRTGPQPQDRGPGGGAVEARRLLRARQGTEGADQSGPDAAGPAADVRVAGIRTLPRRLRSGCAWSALRRTCVARFHGEACRAGRHLVSSTASSTRACAWTREQGR